MKMKEKESGDVEQEQETGATVFRLTEKEEYNSIYSLKITETLTFEFDFEIECSIQILKSKSNLL